MSKARTTAKKFRKMGLTAPEKKLWQALEGGKLCRFQLKAANKDRTLRGDILDKILRGEDIEGIKPPDLPRQFWLFGAIISGVLDMSDTNIGLTLIMRICRFNEKPNFNRAEFALLDFKRSHFEKGAMFSRLSTKGHLWLDKIISNGEINIAGAHIGGSFMAKNAYFSNPEGDAIFAQSTNIIGGVFFPQANIAGCTNFHSSKIGGQFTATDAHFSNLKGNAIDAQSSDIVGGVFLSKANITGCANFNSSKIGLLALVSADFSNPKGYAIQAYSSDIIGGVFLRRANITGCANFSGAKIGGDFSAEGARFSCPLGKSIQAQGVEIGGVVSLIEFPYPPLGSVNFVNAQFGHMLIDENSYPLGRLVLDGARYPNIDVAGYFGKAAPMEGWLWRPKKRTPMTRLNTFMALRKTDGSDQGAITMWKGLLSRDTKHERSPFAYRQFAQVLDAHGHEREARNVRVESGNAYTHRIAQTFSPWRARLYRIWRFIISYLIAYGIKPWRIFIALFVLWVVGFAIFGLNADRMTPAKERFYLSQVIYEADGKTVKAYKELSATDKGPWPKGYPDYSPLIYALDVMLPVVDFAQESHWRPKNADNKRWNWLRIFNRFFLALGWAFSTVAVLGFTGLISDKKEY